MAARAGRKATASRRDALAAAVAINMSTLVQAVLVTWVIDARVARAVLVGAIAGIAVVLVEVALLLAGLSRGKEVSAEVASIAEDRDFGRPMSVRTSIVLATVLAVLLMATRAAAQYFGGAGALVVSAIGGLVDAHAAAIAAASAASAGTITVSTAALAIGLGLLTNLGVKLGLAGSLGGARFAAELAGLLVPVATAVGLGLAFGQW